MTLCGRSLVTLSSGLSGNMAAWFVGKVGVWLLFPAYRAPNGLAPVWSKADIFVVVHFSIVF